MRTRIPGLLLATTIGLAGLLSACGNDDADEPDTRDDTTQSAEESGDTGDTGDTGEADPGQDEAAPEASGDKPSREEVIEGYREIVIQGGEQAGVDIPDDAVTAVVTCFIDELYEEASPTTLQALADENVAGIDPADAELFATAQATCQQKVG